MAVTTGPRRRGWGELPRRVAAVSVHTSPLDQPGAGDAGGMNVWVVEVARRLAAFGVEVDIFTRATSPDQPPYVEMADGVTVRHVAAGPLAPLPKEELPAQLCAFTAGMLAREAWQGAYDVVHSHYWLSGHVGWLARERWDVPLVHSMHTMAKVKNAALADGDRPEPSAREIGEAQVVAAADRLIASTDEEAHHLVSLYGAARAQVATVAPGVDLERFRPGSGRAARRRLGIRDDAVVLLFVGRIQPLKAPDVLLRAAAELRATDPEVGDRLVVLVAGGASGTGVEHPQWLPELAASLGIADCVRFLPPLPADELAEVYRAATLTVVPSHSESFGLVALESQACGTPVVAAAVGGLTTAVVDGESGVLVGGHDPRDYAQVIGKLAHQSELLTTLGEGAVAHARHFGWSVTAARVVQTYRDAITEANALTERVCG